MNKKWPFKAIDLTHTLSSAVPTWNGSCGFEHRVTLDYAECTTAAKFRVQKLEMHAGIGTHIDAPSHCIEGGKCVADLDLNDLIAPCVMIDVSKKASEGYTVDIEDLKIFEAQHGRIANGSFVIVYTGWERYWPDPEKYRCEYHYPSLSTAFALALIERKVVGVGIDTLSPDRPDTDFPVHQVFLGAGKYIVENIAHAHLLPPVSAYALVLPIKIDAGTEAPVRMIGLVME